MRRVVSVWLPAWPITRLFRAEPKSIPPDLPFALVETGVHGLTITAINATASRAGLTAGVSLADARAAFPGLISRPAEPRRDRAALLRLARWAGRYGPSRHADGADGLWIDVSGVTHLFDGEKALLDDLTGRLSGFGVKAQAGLADTLGAAHALSRFACAGDDVWALAKQGETRAALAEIPVEGLRLAPGSVLLLKRLGLRRIGQLYDIPRASLERRFRSADAANAVLTRLDQALGCAREPLCPLVEPPALFVARSFSNPLISSEALEDITGELCADLAAHLKAEDLALRAVKLMIYRADGTAGAVSAAMSAPCGDGSHIMSLLAEKIAAFDAGFGVDLLRLEATRVAHGFQSQDAFPADGPHMAADAAPLIDRLVNRLGESSVMLLAPWASHIPERAEVRAPALEALPLALNFQRTSALPWHYQTGPLRPPFLLRRPEPILVVAGVPDGPPARFVWRRVERRVIRAEGPERIAPEWWRALHIDDGSRTRDYYRIEDEQGSAYWVFRHGLYGGGHDEGYPSWFLHGLFA
ncbi:MAG: Y-family DNA polymerase [Hyphomicrobium sp.]